MEKEDVDVVVVVVDGTDVDEESPLLFKENPPNDFLVNKSEDKVDDFLGSTTLLETDLVLGNENVVLKLNDGALEEEEETASSGSTFELSLVVSVSFATSSFEVAEVGDVVSVLSLLSLDF